MNLPERDWLNGIGLRLDDRGGSIARQIVSTATSQGMGPAALPWTSRGEGLPVAPAGRMG